MLVVVMQYLLDTLDCWVKGSKPRVWSSAQLIAQRSIFDCDRHRNCRTKPFFRDQHSYLQRIKREMSNLLQFHPREVHCRARPWQSEYPEHLAAQPIQCRLL